jgi:ethanolamine-phosphate cytidylyltransferase
LACKYVDEVVIGAPYIITNDLIKTLNIHKVIGFVTNDDKPLPEHERVEQYLAAKELKIFEEIPALENDLTLEIIA